MDVVSGRPSPYLAVLSGVGRRAGEWVDVREFAVFASLLLLLLSLEQHSLRTGLQVLCSDQKSYPLQ